MRNGSVEEWKLFEKYHYLNRSHAKLNSKDIFILEYESEPIAFCSVKHFPHPKNPKIKSVHRLVVRPDYQGIGVGIRFLENVGRIYVDMGFDFHITTSQFALMK